MELPEKRVFPGAWRATVLKTDENESERFGRVKVELKAVYGENISEDKLPWCYPIFPAPVNVTDNSGWIALPRKGDKVLILFEQGDPDSPLWFGGWGDKNRLPRDFSSNYPNRQGIVTPDGMQVLVEAGKAITLNLGKSGEFLDGKFIEDGQHKQYDTQIILDKKSKKVTIKSKYKIKISSDEGIELRAPQVKLICMPGRDENGAQKPEPKPEFTVITFDPEAEQGSRIVAKPGELRGQAKKVKGFKDR